MIRINLLGRVRPKAARRAVPLEATLQVVFLVVALAVALGFLFIHWRVMSRDLKRTQEEIVRLQSEKVQLEQLKQQIDGFERQKAVLQQRIAVIEDLDRKSTRLNSSHIQKSRMPSSA